jgi:hypothetical protein
MHLCSGENATHLALKVGRKTTRDNMCQELSREAGHW